MFQPWGKAPGTPQCGTVGGTGGEEGGRKEAAPRCRSRLCAQDFLPHPVSLASQVKHCPQLMGCVMGKTLQNN